MLPRFRIRIIFHLLRQVPVDQNASSILGDEDISCTDVPMQDSSLVVRISVGY